MPEEENKEKRAETENRERERETEKSAAVQMNCSCWSVCAILPALIFFFCFKRERRIEMDNDDKVDYSLESRVTSVLFT